MEKANRYGFNSIAFPLLGTRKGRFPVKVAWTTLLRQIIKDLSDENPNIVEVVVALHKRRIVEELNVKSFLENLEKFEWKLL